MLCFNFSFQLRKKKKKKKLIFRHCIKTFSSFYGMGLGGAEETSSFMSEFIRKCGGCVVIDGGFATELERHGADLNDPLWSAKCLIDSPHLVRRVHTHSLSLSLSLSLVFSVWFSGKMKNK